MISRLATCATLLSCLQAASVAQETLQLQPALRDRCLAVLREGVGSDEFWPAMHAAEALTLAGCQSEVLAALAKRTAADDQQACGLAREAVRAGDRRKIQALLDILAKPGSNGHTHAAESLFKVAEVGDGTKLRAALAQSADIKLQCMAAAALARCGHPSALDTVRPYLASDDVENRKVAAWILGQIGAPTDSPPLQRALSQEQDPLAKGYYINALACLGNDEARGLLGENFKSEVPAVRTYSAEFAGYCRATSLQAALVAMLRDEVLDVRIRAAQSLLVLSLPAANLGLPAAVMDYDLSRNVYPASADRPRYSEGSLAVLADSSLLYATTEFLGGRADHATAQIIGRVSTDRGQTWSEPHVLQANTGKQNVMSATLRRLVPGSHTGPLGLFYLVKNAPDDLQAWLKISTDESKTFGEPIRVSSEPGYHVLSNDRVTVLHSGRIVCPVAWTDNVAKAGGGHFVSFCYFSDDGGRSWHKSTGQVDQPRRGAMEPEVVELSANQLLMIVRTQTGKIATSLSTDGGNQWSLPSELPVQSPESPATIRKIPATGDLLLVWNNTFTPGENHGGKRTPLSTAISSDAGQTWRLVNNLESEPDQGYAYTSVTYHRDRILFTYYVSDSSTGQISSRFRSLPVSWLYRAPK